jgi:hypothetical protein
LQQNNEWTLTRQAEENEEKVQTHGVLFEPIAGLPPYTLACVFFTCKSLIFFFISEAHRIAVAAARGDGAGNDAFSAVPLTADIKQQLQELKTKKMTITAPLADASVSIEKPTTTTTARTTTSTSTKPVTVCSPQKKGKPHIEIDQININNHDNHQHQHDNEHQRLKTAQPKPTPTPSSPSLTSRKRIFDDVDDNTQLVTIHSVPRLSSSSASSSVRVAVAGKEIQGNSSKSTTN